MNVWNGDELPKGVEFKLGQITKEQNSFIIFINS